MFKNYSVWDYKTKDKVGACFSAVVYFATSFVASPSDCVWIVPGTYED